MAQFAIFEERSRRVVVATGSRDRSFRAPVEVKGCSPRAAGAYRQQVDRPAIILSNLIESLSESQKGCLRLVGNGLSSKEIAIETGLSPQTVDTYLKVAIGRLGASNRREAARMLAAWELSQKSGSPAPTVADPAPDRQSIAATGGGRIPTWLLPPPLGGKTNDLAIAERTFAIFRVAAIGTTVVIALALFIAGAFDFLR